MAFTLIVSSQTVTGETVSSGTQSIVNDGIASSTAIEYSGYQNISSGGAANDTTINDSGTQIVFSGGAANNTTINYNGTQTISSGGAAANTSISYDGTQNVLIGGTVNNTVLSGYYYYNAVQNVAGIASSATINDYGIQTVLSGGVASDTTINCYGSQIVSSGGSAGNTIVNSGGSMMISSGGRATDFTVASGGILGWDFDTVISGGTSNGNAVSNNNGKTSYNLYLSYANQYVSSGYTANFTDIDYYGRQTVLSGGAANDTTINYHGTQTISSGGAAGNTTISSGGSQVVYGSASVINQQSGAAIIADTSASITSGVNARADGHSAFSITGGAASNFLLENGGCLSVLSGNSAIDTVIAYAGRQTISSGGAASDTIVSSGGAQDVLIGGMANGTVLSGDYYDAVQYVTGIASATTIDGYGVQYVSSGGAASDTIVNSGGSMYVGSGGSVTGALTIAGGHVVLDDAASVSSLMTMAYVLTTAETGDVLFISNDGTLGAGATAYLLNVDNTETGSYILADGVDLSGLSGKTFSVTDNGQTLDLTVGSSCTFSNGDMLSLNFTDSTFDQLTAVVAAMPRITVVTTDATAREPSNDGTFRISRTGDTADALTVYFNTGGSATEGSDYTLRNGSTALTDSVVIAAGQSYADVTLDVIDDGIAEDPETATLNLVANAAYNFGATTGGTINITDYDPNSLDVMLVLDYSGSMDGSPLSQLKSAACSFVDMMDFGDNIGVVWFDDLASLGYSLNQVASNANVSIVKDGINNAYSGGMTSIGAGLQLANSNLETYGNADKVIILMTDGYENTSPMAADVKGEIESGTHIYTVGFGGADSYLLTDIATNYGAADGAYFDGTASDSALGLQRIYRDLSIKVGGEAQCFLKTSSISQGETQTYNVQVSALQGGEDFIWRIDWPGSNLDMELIAPDGQVYDHAAVLANPDMSLVEESTYEIIRVSNAAAGNWQVNVTGVDVTGNEEFDISVSTSGNPALDTVPPAVPVTLTQIVTGSSAALDWADATDEGSGVKQYEFQVDNNSDFSSSEKSGTAVASNADATGLADGTYYWRVRTQDNAGNYSEWSTVSNFMVDATAPAVPAALTQIAAGNSVALDWADATDGGSGVKQYEVQLDKHIDFSTPEYSASPAASAANLGGLTDGTFYWRVRTQDNAGNYSAWAIGSSFISDLPGNINGALLFSAPSTTGWVGLGDPADYYKLTLGGAGKLSLTLAGLSGDANLTLYDGKGKQLKTSSRKGHADENIADLLLYGGDYYVKVAPADSGKSAANNTPYTLNKTLIYFPDATDNNTYQKAAALALDDAGSGSDAGWVGFGDATNYYQFTTTKAGSFDFALGGGAGASAKLTLYSLSKGKLAQFKSVTMKKDGTAGIDDVLLTAGTWYAAVDSADKGKGIANTDYALNVSGSYFPEDTVGNTQAGAAVIGELADKVIVELPGWVGFGDPADYYQLTLTNNGTLNLNLTGLSSDANLTLLDNKGKVLKTSANRKFDSEAISTALLAGDYFVKVAPADGGKGTINNTHYTLSNMVDYYPEDKLDNVPSGASYIGGLADKVTVELQGWVGFGDPADYYQLTLAGAGALNLNLTGLSGDANLTLLDNKGKVLKTSANRKNADEAISTTLAAGDYFVKVAPADGGKGTVSNTPYTLINYFLEETAGSSFATAVELTSDGTIHGWVGSGNKEDYYKFEALADGATAAGGLSGFDSNVNLYIYDSKHKLVESSTQPGLNPESIDSGAGNVDAGIYYVKVMLAGTAATEYDLNFNLTQPGSLRIIGAAGTLTGSAETSGGDPLKKNNGLLAS